MGTSAEVDRLEVVAGATLAPVCPLPARPDPAFDRIARLVQAQLHVPVSLVTLVSRSEQVFPGALGLAEPWQSQRRTPLTHSVCQHVVLARHTLMLDDVRTVPALAGNLAAPELGVVAYAGAPLVDADGAVVGSLCAIDTEPRAWSDAERRALEDLAATCSSELVLRQLRQRSQDAAAAAVAAERTAARTAAEGPGADHRATVLLGLSEGLVETSTVEDVVVTVAALALTELGADHAGLGVRRKDVALMSYLTSSDVSDEARSRWVDVALTPDTPAGRVMLSDQPMFFTDHEQMLREFPALVGEPVLGGSGARACLPLTVLGSSVGALFLGWPEAREFDARTRQVLAAMGRYTAQAVSRAQLQAEGAAMSETLQRAMLTELPHTEHLELHARYLPAADTEQVGGDWYDAVVSGDGAVTLVIGDVMGHDANAAAAMGQLRSTARTLVWAFDEPPSALLTHADRATSDLGASTLATCLVVRLERREPDAEVLAAGERRLVWSNAGHLPLLLITPDGHASYLDAQGDLLLGVEPASVRHDLAARVPVGSTVLLFTDGLVERRGRSIEEGLEALRAAVERHAARPLDELVSTVLDELVHADVVGRRPQHSDDVAVLAARLLDVPDGAVSAG